MIFSLGVSAPRIWRDVSTRVPSNSSGTYTAFAAEPTLSKPSTLASSLDLTPNLWPIIIDAELGLVNRVAQLATGVSARNAPYNRHACVAEHDRLSFRRRLIVHGI